MPAPPASMPRCRSRRTWSASTPWSPTPTTCRCGAARKICSAPIRSRSPFRRARRRRWCSTSPPRSSPTARSRPTSCRASRCRAGWMIDKQGQPLTDSAKSAEGLLLPIGGHKGSGLALVLGLLAGTLNGAAFGRDVVDFNYDDETACDTGHFIVALDVSRFLPIAAFKAAVDRHLRDLKSSQTLPGVDAIRLPGEQRPDAPRRACARRRAGLSGGDRRARQAGGRAEGQAAARRDSSAPRTPSAPAPPPRPASSPSPPASWRAPRRSSDRSPS